MSKNMLKSKKVIFLEKGGKVPPFNGAWCFWGLPTTKEVYEIIVKSKREGDFPLFVKIHDICYNGTDVNTVEALEDTHPLPAQLPFNDKSQMKVVIPSSYLRQKNSFSTPRSE